MNTILSKIVSVFFFLLFYALIKVSASPVIEIVNGQEKYTLIHGKIDTINDPFNKWTIEDISSPSFDKLFKQDRNPIKPFYDWHSTTWVRFAVKNSSDYNYFLLEFANHSTDEIDYFIPQTDGTFKKIKAGGKYSFNSKEYSYRTFVFDLPTSSKAQTYYLRIQSENPGNLIFRIYTYKRFISYAVDDYFSRGLIYGLLLAIAVYNLFIFFSIRETQYLYYVAYLCLILYYLMMDDGTGFQYLTPENSYYSNYPFAFVIISAIIILLLQFSRRFLLTYKHSPVFDKILVGAIIVRVIVFVFKFLFDPQFDVLYLDACLLFLAYAGGFISLLKGYNHARFYIVAFTLFFISYIIYIINLRQLLNIGEFVYSPLQIGTLSEAFFFSFALADRMKNFKYEKEKAQERIIEELKKNEFQLKENELLKDKVNRELEEKVKERTEQIHFQSLEIERINAILHEHNKQLEHNVKDLSKARVMQKTVSFDEFKQIYPDEEACFKYLAELKWGKGFECKKCKNKNYFGGKALYSRRCSRCKYTESVTAGTIFNKLKFSIVKAFYLLFLVSSGKEMTADELSETLSLRRETCWGFKKKVLDVMNNKKIARRHKDGWSHLILEVELPVKEI